MEMVSRERAGAGEGDRAAWARFTFLWLAGDYLSVTGNHLVDSSKRTTDQHHLLFGNIHSLI